MGKKNFRKLYKTACRSLGIPRGTIKISHFCDRYHPNKNYAGIIIYHHNGKHKWKNTKGVAKGYNCRSFYVHIQCTDKWDGDAFNEAGQGRVHDKMYKDMLGEDFRGKATCCGGFAVMKGVAKFSSVWLNQQENNGLARLPWKSDGSKNLSAGEKSIVKFAIDKWKQQGTDIVLTIPENIHNSLTCNSTAASPIPIQALTPPQPRNQVVPYV